MGLGWGAFTVNQRPPPLPSRPARGQAGCGPGQAREVALCLLVPPTLPGRGKQNQKSQPESPAAETEKRAREPLQLPWAWEGVPDHLPPAVTMATMASGQAQEVGMADSGVPSPMTCLGLSLLTRGHGEGDVGR